MIKKLSILMVMILITGALYSADSVPYIFEAGDTALASEVNANFDHIMNRLWKENGTSRYYNSGKVGIGTTNPNSQLHVNGDGVDPSLRVQVAGFSKFIVATNGGVSVGANETTPPSNGLYVSGVVGIGTTNPGQKLSVAGTIESTSGGFKFPDGTTQTTASAGGSSPWSSGTGLIYYSGNVGIGTNSPNAQLDVVYDGVTTGPFNIRDSDGDNLLYLNYYSGVGVLNVCDNGAAKVILDGQDDCFFNSGNVMINYGVATSYRLDVNGTIRGYGITDASSKEYKENIRELTNSDAIKTLLKLNPTIYNYKNEKDEERLGFIAEDVPELVATKDREGLCTMDIVAVLTKVVQNQQEIIKELQARIEELEKK